MLPSSGVETASTMPTNSFAPAHGRNVVPRVAHTLGTDRYGGATVRETMAALARAHLAFAREDEAVAEDLFVTALSMEAEFPDIATALRTQARWHRVNAIGLRAKGMVLAERYERLLGPDEDGGLQTR